jgi:hypothetical protein
MSFSLILKYNIFCSENLPANEIQHCLHHGMLLESFEMFEFENFEASKSDLHVAWAPNDLTLCKDIYIPPPFQLIRRIFFMKKSNYIKFNQAFRIDH